ncbi:MAG: hypothetical protein C0484_24585 [Rhodospirillum sp.]|nr:hypothetical protein [Rhodospirillum sp.]
MARDGSDGTFEARRDMALRLLAGTGIPQWQKAPPLFRFLWFCGIRVRPPHFSSFLFNFAFFGVFFGALWVLLTLPFQWSRYTSDIVSAVWPVAAIFGFSGLVMAFDFWRTARKHRLRKWSELRTETEIFD